MNALTLNILLSVLKFSETHVVLRQVYRKNSSHLVQKLLAPAVRHFLGASISGASLYFGS
jgi:hypothetical protein